jgi:hypothetical protein
MCSIFEDECSPGTEVVHLLHTTSNLPTVMGSVWLPILTRRAPWWSPIIFAHEDVPRVEVLETWRIRICPRVIASIVGYCKVRTLARMGRFASALASIAILFLPYCQWSQWYISGVLADHVQYAEVTRCHKQEEDKIYDDYCYRSGSIISAP